VVVAAREPMMTGAVLTFVSAETGQPVAGADLLIGSAGRYRTDGGGQIRLAESVPLPVTIQASSGSYLLRETLLRPEDQGVLTLWPRQSPTGLDEELTRTLVYTEAAGGTIGALPLRRMRPGPVGIAPSPEILADPAATAALQEAAEALTRATAGRVQYVIDPPATSPVVVRVVVDPRDPAMGSHSALTYRSVEASHITGARIVFVSLKVARIVSIVTHELAHTFGLEHSRSAQDLMYPMVAEHKVLSSRETLAIDLMLKRRPGNRFPDNDQAGAEAMSRYVDVVVCR
jgi:hypothetical protein